jgi:polyhydroxybutyrate depolymerase
MTRHRRLAGCLAVAIALAAGAAGATASSAAVSSRAAAGAATPVAPKPSIGCRLLQAIPSGQRRIKLKPGSYLRYIPHAYTGSSPFPLVIDLHGYLEEAQFHANNSGLGAYGDAHGFVTITPEGADKTGPPSFTVEFHSADVRFILHVLDVVEHKLCIDERRVFVTGYSNGAMVASTLACIAADRIAAIAPVSGLRDPANCHPSRPIPIVTFHGTADRWVAFTGGLGPDAKVARGRDRQGHSLAQTSSGKSVARGGPIPVIVSAWAARNGCSAPTTTTVAADVHLVHYPCTNGADVELYRIEGAGHTWPGSTVSAAVKTLGSTTLSISADALMWAFFEAHPLPLS